MSSGDELVFSPLCDNEGIENVKNYHFKGHIYKEGLTGYSC